MLYMAVFGMSRSQGLMKLKIMDCLLLESWGIPIWYGQGLQGPSGSQAGRYWLDLHLMGKKKAEHYAPSWYTDLFIFKFDVWADFLDQFHFLSVLGCMMAYSAALNTNKTLRVWCTCLNTWILGESTRTSGYMAVIIQVAKVSVSMSIPSLPLLTVWVSAKNGNNRNDGGSGGWIFELFWKLGLW